MRSCERLKEHSRASEHQSYELEQILLGVHADPFSREPLRNFSMAIQAERHDQVGVMRFPYDVMILKETM